MGQSVERYNCHFEGFELTYRMSQLDNNYESIRSAQATWLQSLPDPKQLYTKFYKMMHRVSHNIVCGCCGIIGHNIDEFTMLSADGRSLASLAVNPNIVPFSFDCGIVAIDQRHIMIDPQAIAD